MANQYWICPDEISETADEIIAAHHPHLDEASILFLFKDKASKKAGKLTAGTASRMTPKENAIAGGDTYAFKIVLAFDLWTLNGEAWRKALIDHELCHCYGEWDEDEETMKWSLRTHDIEEFAEIVERHGLWKHDVQTFVERVGQLELFQ